MSGKLIYGCTDYVSVGAVIQINFPRGKVICDLCEFCHAENAGTRFRCNRTAEILPFHNNGIGLRCPFRTEIEQQMEVKDL